MYALTVYDVDTVPDDVTVATLANEFRENETVEYADGTFGLIVETHESPFEFDGEEVDASSSEPMYVVARETGGSKPFSADELDEADPERAFRRDQAELDDPTADIADAELSSVYATAAVGVAELDVPGVDDPGVGWDSFPPSWEDANRPARVILLDAWTSMNASFDGCVREMQQLRNPKAFCASMKDEVYGYEGWRN